MFEILFSYVPAVKAVASLKQGYVKHKTLYFLNEHKPYIFFQMNFI